ncbi:TetR/AcrR family transcriptional regulator [Nonomuraea soli]|uniref:AcrR family transcriptional regulator n=1 Tax=Nonomuraea soli TaxID=1032476 RepID=A0A7W0CKS8_9ACTN|nr:TetR/AcrR family transcriptional regulator [Nonomuraea soli]MBA2892802.1 AcrR family transcriptional regulator [Nonomuraea soli]
MTRQETRLKVFAAAIELMAEQGYTATTVEAIAERAGVAKGTVFYNFGSKEQLFAQLLDYGIGLLADAMGEAGDLDAAVLAQLEFFARYGPFARVLLAEMWRTAWQDAVAALRSRVISVYERHVPGGVAPTAVFGMVLTVSIERKVLRPDRSIEEVHTELMDLLRGRITS